MIIEMQRVSYHFGDLFINPRYFNTFKHPEQFIANLIIQSMPRPKKGTKLTEAPSQNEPTGSSKLYAIRGRDLISQISEKCLYLPQLMTSRRTLLDSLLEQRWQEMVNDRLHKYPYPPSSKLFNKISQECWNEIYRQNEENEACFRNFQLTEAGLIEEIRKISAQLASIEQAMVSSNSN